MLVDVGMTGDLGAGVPDQRHTSVEIPGGNWVPDDVRVLECGILPEVIRDGYSWQDDARVVRDEQKTFYGHPLGGLAGSGIADGHVERLGDTELPGCDEPPDDAEVLDGVGGVENAVVLAKSVVLDYYVPLVAAGYSDHGALVGNAGTLGHEEAQDAGVVLGDVKSYHDAE